MKTALPLTGAVYNEWAGKPQNEGWNEHWWQATGNPEYPYRGLDCSGFVKWAYWTSHVGGHEGLNGTGGICSPSIVTSIDKSQILPGDLGVIFYGGSGAQTNHIGIYVGKDENGADLWCHCTGGSLNTVVLNNTDCFKMYLRVNAADLNGDSAWRDWNDFTIMGFDIGNVDICIRLRSAC